MHALHDQVKEIERDIGRAEERMPRESLLHEATELHVSVAGLERVSEARMVEDEIGGDAEAGRGAEPAQVQPTAAAVDEAGMRPEAGRQRQPREQRELAREERSRQRQPDQDPATFPPGLGHGE